MIMDTELKLKFIRDENFIIKKYYFMYADAPCDRL